MQNPGTLSLFVAFKASQSQLVSDPLPDEPTSCVPMVVHRRLGYQEAKDLGAFSQMSIHQIPLFRSGIARNIRSNNLRIPGILFRLSHS